MRRITKHEAALIYEILIVQAGARDTADERYAFIQSVALNPKPATECRFSGRLGSGGKFRNNGNNNNTPHVDCYPEHLTQERQIMIEQCNRVIAHLLKENHQIRLSSDPKKFEIYSQTSSISGAS
jgi:hypothetical protein